MPEYTLGAVGACVLVVLAERFWFQTGLFRQRAFWIGWVIVIFFQCLMDGWLTKLSAPIVIYDEKFSSGWRFPWDIPIEDFPFGFALVTLGLILWLRSEGPSDRPNSGAQGSVERDDSP